MAPQNIILGAFKNEKCLGPNQVDRSRNTVMRQKKNSYLREEHTIVQFRYNASIDAYFALFNTFFMSFRETTPPS